MSATALATWAVVALLGVMTPGIDTMLVLRHTILGGGRSRLAVVGGSRVRGVLLRDRVRAWLERATAVVLIGVGVRLAAESR